MIFFICLSIPHQSVMHKFLSLLYPLPPSILYTWYMDFCVKNSSKTSLLFALICTEIIFLIYDQRLALSGYIHFLSFPFLVRHFYFYLVFLPKKKSHQIRKPRPHPVTLVMSFIWISFHSALNAWAELLPHNPWTQTPPQNSSAREGDAQMLKFPQHTQFCTGVTSPHF